MRVLFVATHINVGGITRYLLTLGSELKERSVDVIVASSGGDSEAAFASRNIETVRIDLATKSELHPKVVSSAFAVARLVRERSIDIIHAHTRVAQVAAALASFMTGVPYVTTCHGFFKRRLGRLLFGCWGERVIAISEPVGAHLVRDLGVRPDKVRLIRTGIEVSSFERVISPEAVRTIRSEAGIFGHPVIGSIGRLSPVKGFDVLIDAAALARKKVPSLGVLLVGNGPEEERLKRRAAERGIEGAVTFVRASHDTVSHLAAMDIFILPSIAEGLGLSLLEAMAAGRPCVASRVGGIPDVITDGKNGLLVTPGDPQALSEAIVTLLLDERLKRELASAGRLTVREHFSMKAMGEAVERLYTETAALRSRG